MRPSSRIVKIIAAVGIIGIAIGVYMWMHAGEETTDDATIEAHVVTISPKVSGYVSELHIDDNQPVKAGDVLLVIDPTDYRIAKTKAEATVAAAEAALSASGQNLATTRISAPSGTDAARAQVAAAEANLNKARHDLKRLEALSEEARSREQLDAVIAAEKTAQSNLEDARARLRSAETAPRTIAAAKSTAEQLAAQLKQAQAQLAQAEYDLSQTRIIAPMDGRITKRAVERGDYVQPGQQLTFLAGNDVWVIASYKETQLARIRPGQPVSLHIDALPGFDFKGKVDSIQSGTGARFSAFPPENATGNYVKIVQRVPVKILFDGHPESTLPIGPGLSVVPVIYTR